MASVSESSFGNRLNNAQTLATNLQSIANYSELNSELSIANLNSKVQELLVTNSEIAVKAQTYSASVDAKQKIFTKDSNSIAKIVTPIIANVRSIYGKNATETQNINNLITKIRGIEVALSATAEITKTVSQSERSYGTMLQTFSDLISTLTIFGVNYAPTNAELSVVKLTQKRDLATQINIKSIEELGALKIARESRTTKYEQLSQLCQRLKETIKAQYGTQSVEYKPVKGIKI